MFLLERVALLLRWILLLGLLPGHAMADLVRRPAVADLFYPGNKKALTSLVEGYLAKAPLDPCSKEEIVALIVPHAGYLYSGKIAAHAYRQIRGNDYEVVVLIGPSHLMGFEGASLYNGDYYETPLGRVKINRTLSEALVRQNKGFRFLPEAHEREHSLEVQLPFLQRSLSDFSLVPILMGSASLSTCKAVAQGLANQLSGKKALLVASSDLSHYHPSEVARQLDQSAIEAIQAMDGPGLISRMESGSCELCGGGPVAAVLLAAKGLGAEHVTILRRGDSSEASGDSSSVVGYMAAAISKGGGTGASAPAKAQEHLLSPGQKHELLAMARRAIETCLSQEKVLQPEPADARLMRPGAAFVTLTRRGELRGCIGYTEAIHPLCRTVTECAIAAAISDPRFPPLKPSELKEVKLEISVLSALKEIQDVSEIKVGRDGILIEKGGRKGLLLPQVAIEYHWDRNAFLEMVCYKAGLPKDAWRQGAKILIFSAEVFHEER
jgi:hypothetical protein